MQTQNEFADQVFDVLRFSIDLACSEQHWHNVSRDALAFGFTQTDISTAFAYAQRFDLKLDSDIYLCLHYRSFDPSGPFRTLPAVSKFELSLSVGGTVIRSHKNGFDEPLLSQDEAAWNELSFA